MPDFAPTDHRRGVIGAAEWVLLVALLVLPCLIGSGSSVVALVIALGLGWPMLRRPHALAVLRQPAVATLISVFVLLTVIFTVTAHEPADVRYAANFLALLLTPVVTLMARDNLIATPRTVLLLAVGGAVVGAVTAAVSIAAFAQLRGQGLFGGPNLLPRIAIILGFFGMGAVLLLPERQRFVAYVGPAAAIAAALLSSSRGALIALPALLLIAAVLLAIRPSTRRDLLLLLVAAIAIGGAVLLLVPTAGERLSSIVPSIVDAVSFGEKGDVATLEREGMVRAGWEAFQTAPILGHGWAHLGTAAAAVEPTLFPNAAGTPFMFHNDLVDFAVAGGIVGAGLLVLLLAAPLIGLLAVRRDDALRPLRIYGALILSVATLVFGLTDMTLGYDLTTTLYAFLTALLFGWPARHSDGSGSSHL